MRSPTLILTGMMLAVAPATFAQSTGSIGTAGAKVLEALNELLNSPVMLIIGLGLAVIGVWTWLVKQEAMVGILLIIGGDHDRCAGYFPRYHHGCYPGD